jgi:hypothetical protein
VNILQQIASFLTEHIALILGVVTAISLIVSTHLLRRTYIQDKKLRTLEYATSQLDMLAKFGSREELRKLRGREVLDYVNSIPEDSRDAVTQSLMQYIYAFNRIGAGIYTKSLAEDVVFQILTPQWFEGHWSRWKSFILSKKERRGEEASGAYVYFQWLAEVKCPKVRKKYPKYQRHL